MRLKQVPFSRSGAWYDGFDAELDVCLASARRFARSGQRVRAAGQCGVACFSCDCTGCADVVAAGRRLGDGTAPAEASWAAMDLFDVWTDWRHDRSKHDWRILIEFRGFWTA